MKKVFALLLSFLGVWGLQAQLTCTGGMSVSILGSSTGVPLSISNAVTSNYNGFGVSCNLATTGPNNNGQVTATVTGGSANFTYSLYQATTVGGTAQATSSATTSTTHQFNALLGSNAGTDYIVSVTDGNGCTANAPASVSMTAPTSLVAGTCKLADDLCQLNAGSVQVQALGGVSPAAVTWTASAVAPFTGTPGGSPAGTPGQSISTVGPTPGSVTYTGMSGNSNYNFVVTDANGCVVQ